MDNWSISSSHTTDGINWSKAVIAINTSNAPLKNEHDKKRSNNYHKKNDYSNNELLAFSDKPWIMVNKINGEIHIVANTQFPYAVISFDDGAKWSNPVLMDNEITDPYYYFYAGGGNQLICFKVRIEILSFKQLGGCLSDGTIVAIFGAVPNNAPPYSKDKPYGYVRAYFFEQKSWRASTVSVIQNTNSVLQKCPKSAQCNDAWDFFSTSATGAVRDGEVHVVWFEGNNRRKFAGLGIVYYSVSTDKGYSWSPKMQISPSPINYAYTGFPSISISSFLKDPFIGFMSNSTGLWKTYIYHSGLTQSISEGFVFPFGDYWRTIADDTSRTLHAVWGQSINGWFLNGTTQYSKASY